MGQENEETTVETTVEPTTEKEPSQETPPESEISGTGLEFEDPDFAAITDFVESDGEEPVTAEAEITDEVVAAEVAPAEPAAEETSESPPTEKAVEEPPEPEVPAEEPEETPPVAEVAAEPELEPEPTKVPTREELEGLYKEHREKTLPQLAELFQLTEEEAAALDEQPSKMVPQLAGQMMYDTMLSTYNAVMTALPRVIGTYMAASEKATSAETDFFKVWPQLDKKASVPAVSAAIQAYRAANPRAVLPDIIQNAGVMAMINLGMDPTKKAEEKPKPTRAAPAKPAAPRGQSPIPPKKPGSEESNVFTELSELMQEESF